MKPRRILTGEETSTILDEAVRQSALAVLTVHQEEGWQMFKSRFLERDPRRRFIVLDYQPTHGTEPTPLASGQYVGLSFRYKSRKVMFAKYAAALVCFPGGFGTLDEFFETMTLVQTQKIARLPIILIGSDFWGSLLDWVRTHQLGEQPYIDAEDIELCEVTDDIEWARRRIGEAYREQSRDMAP